MCAKKDLSKPPNSLKIFFDKKSYLVNELGEPYLLIHQYDKRWEEFKKPLESFRTNIDI